MPTKSLEERDKGKSFNWSNCVRKSLFSGTWTEPLNPRALKHGK